MRVISEPGPAVLRVRTEPVRPGRPALPGHTIPVQVRPDRLTVSPQMPGDRKSTRLNSSHPSISYAVFCLKKKKKKKTLLTSRIKNKNKSNKKSKKKI